MRAVVAVLMLLLAVAQDAPLVSGPKPGDVLPGPFDTLTINGMQVKKLKEEIEKFKDEHKKELEAGEKKVQVELLALEKKAEYARNNQHCLVTEYGLNPVVMIFTREPAKDKDAGLTQLLGKLDGVVERHEDVYMGGAVVFLSPDSRSSANSAEKDAAKLVEETVARKGLTDRLEKRAKELKHVVLAHYPLAGPAKYKLNPKAETTVLLYAKHRVLVNRAFADGVQPEDVDGLVKGIDEAVEKWKKKK